MGLPRALLAGLLLAIAIATTSAHFEQTACGCLANSHGGLLSGDELTRIRAVLTAAGVEPAALSDNVLQALLRFMLQANFPGVVPTTREGILEIYLDYLRQVPSEFILSEGAVSGLVGQLTPGISITDGVQLSLIDVIPATSLVLGLRNVPVESSQLRLVLQNAVASFLSAPGLQITRRPLGQLVAFLDSLDRRLAQIVQLEGLNSVRQDLETRYNLASDLFDDRYRRALVQFQRNRADILNSVNGLVFRGPDFEVQIQRAAFRLSQLFSGISVASSRVVLNILQVTNSAGGRGSPADILSIISTPEIVSSLRSLNAIEIRRVQEHITAPLTVVQVAEAYSIFLIGLASQGINPVASPRSEVIRVFTEQLKNYFLIEGISYDSRSFLLFVTRIVVTQIPRGSNAFQIRIFEPQVVIDEVVLVAQPLRDIFVEGRRSLIADVIGIQGSGEAILRRIAAGGGRTNRVVNIVQLGPRITDSNLPRYVDFAFDGFAITGSDFRRVGVALSSRYSALSLRSFQEPVVRVILLILRSSGRSLPTASPALSNYLIRYINGLPAFPLPSEDTLRGFLPGLEQLGLRLSTPQLNTALQQYIIVAQALGYQVPVAAIPQAFHVSLIRFLNSHTGRELGLPYVTYLVGNLGRILGEVELIDNRIVLTDDQVRQIFASLFGDQMPSLGAMRAIIRLILARLSGDARASLTTPESVIIAFRSQLSQITTAHPIDLYFLSPARVVQVVSSINGITPQQVIDANVLAYFGLGINSLLPAGDKFEAIFRANINRYLRIYRPATLGTSRFIQNIIAFRNRRLDVSHVVVPFSTSLVSQTPVPAVPAPPVLINIGDGIDITEQDYNRFVDRLSGRFNFLTSDSVQPVLGHIVAVLNTAASGDGVTSATVTASVTNFLNGLPDGLRVTLPDDELTQIIGNVDVDDAVRVTGNGIRAGIAGIVFSHLGLPQHLPLPEPVQRLPYFSFLLNRYRSTVSRQQLRFGAPFATYLNGYLPQLPGAAAPYSIFDVPALYGNYQPFFNSFTRISDLPLFTRILSHGAPGQLTLAQLLTATRRLNAQNLNGGLYGFLTDAEVTGLVSYGQTINLPASITGLLIRRAYNPCRLALRLRLGRIISSRADVIGFLRELLQRSAGQLTGDNFLSSRLVDTLFNLISARLEASRPHRKQITFSSRIAIGKKGKIGKRG